MNQSMIAKIRNESLRNNRSITLPSFSAYSQFLLEFEIREIVLTIMVLLCNVSFQYIFIISFDKKLHHQQLCDCF